ncbi:MAG: hypothetical protein U1F66_02620 [bacterium]
MRPRGLFSLWFLLPGLFALVACSGGGGGGNAEADKNAAVQQNRVAEWGKFVGIDPVQAQDELTQAGLIGQVGKNAALNEVEAQAFLELTFAKDGVFSQGIDELNRRNQTAFLSFNVANLKTTANPQILPSLPGTSANAEAKSLALSPSLSANLGKGTVANGPIFGQGNAGFGDSFLEAQEELRALRQKAVDDYAAMSAQAFELRKRVLAGAQILGFRLEPATMQELLADPGFAPIRDKFAAPILFAAFVKKIVGDPDKEGNVSPEGVANAEEKDFGGEPLANVSFRIGNSFVSFYEFNTFIAVPGAPSISIIGTTSTTGNAADANAQPAPAAPTARGSFKVFPAEQNSFPLITNFIPDLEKGK